MKLRPYHAHKDSGVPWLGKVPEHWESPRLTSGLRVENATHIR
jgi:type I restriction enzyme S subunit